MADRDGMLVRLHMTRDVVSFDPDELARDALCAMRKRRFRHAPVVDDDELIGIVTERDLLRVLPGSVGRLDSGGDRRDYDSRVASAMTRDPLTAAPNDPLDQVAALLVERKIGGVPVVDRGRLVGMLTECDVMRAFTSVLAEGDGERVALLRMPRPVTEAFSFDVARVAVEHGLILESYMRHRHANGGVVVIVRLKGDALQIARFRARASDAGLVLIGRPGAGESVA